MNDIVKRLNNLAALVEGEPGGMDMTMTRGDIFREAATYIEHLLSIISDLETSLPILIEGARRPFREEIEHLRTLGDALANGVRTGRYDNALESWDDHRAKLLKVEQRELTDAERKEIRMAFHLELD